MPSFGYDVCDGDGCGERLNQFPFPHLPGCKYGTGDAMRDAEIRAEAARQREEEFYRGPRPW